MTPFASIIIRSFNDRAFIARTLDGIRRQSCSDYEIIHIDSSSTDGTYEIIRSRGGDGLPDPGRNISSRTGP